MGIHGVFMRLFGEFVAGQMIPFSMSDSGRRVSVRCKIMKLCASIVGAQRHLLLLADRVRTLIVVLDAINPFR